MCVKNFSASAPLGCFIVYSMKQTVALGVIRTVDRKAADIMSPTMCCLWLVVQSQEALGVLVSSYCCSSYGAANPFISLGTLSSSFIGGPVFHSIHDCEQSLLYQQDSGIASYETAITGSFQQNLSGIVQQCLGWLWDRSPGGAVSAWSFIQSLLHTLSL